MNKIFVTSDTWFNRLLDDDSDETIVSHNTDIINKWNSCVGYNDDVYVLGGFGIADLFHIVVKLSGNIHFLDNNITPDEKTSMDDMKNLLEKSSDEKLKNRISFENKQIFILEDVDSVLSYFPLEDWAGKQSGTFCFCGMNHKSNIKEHLISCCAIQQNFKPVDIKDIQEHIHKVTSAYI